MATAKRLYLYSVSGIGLGLVLYAATILMGLLFDKLGLGASLPYSALAGVQANRELLSLAIGLVAVGLPLWLFHWALVERMVSGVEAAAAVERQSIVRAVYFGLLLLILVSPSVREFGLAEQDPVKLALAFRPADADHLVALLKLGIGANGEGSIVTDDGEDRAAVRQLKAAGQTADRRRSLAQLGFDQFQFASTEHREVEQLVDRDIGLDRAQDHARRRDDLIHAEMLEEALVLGAVSYTHLTLPT